MNKKIVVFTVAMVLLLGVTIGATFAYLQDISNVVTNTFTYGNVEIDLDEAEVDKYGNLVYRDSESSETDATGGINYRVNANEYKLIPSNTYKKDPTVHLTAASEESYLFVKIENGIDEYLIATDTADHKTIANQMKANGWVELSTLDTESELTDIENVWVYTRDGGTVTGSNLDGDDTTTDVKSYKVFDEITVKDDADVTTINATHKLIVNAYAIQADGFGSAVEAWGAIDWNQAYLA